MIPVRLRKAAEKDSAFLFALRNDILVRQNSFHKEPVTLEEHEAWLRHVLAADDQELWIAESATDDKPAGQIRLDNEGEYGYEISYSVSPAYRGHKVGTIMVGLLMQSLAASAGDVRVFARVLPDNVASQKVFLHNGFIKVRHTDAYLEFEKFVHEV